MKQRICAAAVGFGVAAAVMVSALGCGGRAVAPESSVGTGAGSASAATVKKPGKKLLPRTKQPISPLARAFMDAAEVAGDDPVAGRWIDDANAAVQALESGNPALAQGLGAPPPPVLSAFRALEEWAGSGEPVSIAEQRAEMSALFPSFRLVTSLAAVVEHSDDPRAAQALRFAKALRAPDNAAISIALGSSVAARWGKVLLQARKEPVSAALRDYALTEQDAMALGRALVSESLALARIFTFEDWKREAVASGALDPSVAPPKPRGDGEPGSAFDPSSFSDVVRYREQNGLSTKGDWVTEEFVAYETFWDETEALVVNAATPAEVVEIFEQRTALTIDHPTSMLVRLVGGMVMAPSASQIVTSCLDDAQLYAELLAGAKQK